MHYYQFNIADYRKDTVHLSRLEHGIYRDLIDWYYLDEQPIPLETQSVMRRLRLVSEEEAKALENVLSDFFFQDGGWRHRRIDLDIVEYHAMAEKNKANGKLGGRPKKTQSVSSGLPDESQNNPNQEPLTINQEPIKTKETRAPRFDAQAHLVSIGIDPLIAADWIQHRRALKAVPTMTAIDGIAKEAARAGTSLADALAICCQRGWRGFKAEWLKTGNQDYGAKSQRDIDRDEVGLVLCGRQPQKQERLIIGEVIHAA
jgi:uncharacterized protein YdaU (DUF1376 family)